MATVVLSATSLVGDEVKNANGENLGEIKELMVDLVTGRIVYAVLSFGGFLGIGNKLFAVPWEVLKVDTADKMFIFNIDQERLENAEGFDKDNWPNMANPEWGSRIHAYYGVVPFWER